MNAVMVCTGLLLIAGVGVAGYRSLGPAIQPSESFAAAANPESGSGPAAAALAPAPDPSVFNIELKPPRTNQPPDENQLVAAQGVLQPGARETRSFVLPETPRMKVMLQDEGARYAFRSPSGAMIVPGETKDRVGYESSNAMKGLSVFLLDHPEKGTWTITIEAGRPGVPKPYAVLVSSDGPTREFAQVETMTADSGPDFSCLARPGDPVFIRTFVAQDGRPEPGVRWEVNALTPGGSRVRIPVYDDGHHADGGANDGVFVGAMVPEGQDGLYELWSSVHARSGADYFVASYIDVQAERDLLIADTIAVNPGSPRAGRRVTLTVTAKNAGTVESKIVELELTIDDKDISKQTFGLKAGESKRIVTTWMSLEPDTYRVRLSINPYLEDETDYANNSRSTTVTVR